MQCGAADADATCAGTIGVMTVRWRLTHATALLGGRLALTFEDGLSGEVTLGSDVLTGALARLRDEAYFARVEVVDGVPTWPGGEDLAPDALHDDVRALLEREAS